MLEQYTQERALCERVVEETVKVAREMFPGADVHPVTEHGSGRLKGWMLFTDAGTLFVNMTISPTTPDPDALAKVRFEG
jgi:hypothetical protein